MTLKSKYRPITIEENTDGVGDWDAPAWTDITQVGDIAFIQHLSGDEFFKQSKSGENVVARMYQPMDTPTMVVKGHRITQDGNEYLVTWANPQEGISGKNNHKEILLGVFE